MELDDRKRKILLAIIQNYQDTGEPVGSRTISKMNDLNYSPATIRNEMADLEEMGLIVQPHTSAGRVPTDKGYRLYVDHLLTNEETGLTAAEGPQLPATHMEQLLSKRMDRVEEMLMRMAQVLAANTQYTTMVTGPHYKQNKLKFIQLSAIGGGKLLAVIVLNGNIVKNNILDIGCDLDQETLGHLNFSLNSNLNGLSVEEINLPLITKVKEEAGEYADIAVKVLDAVAGAFDKEDSMPVYTSGATNIFKYPELADNEKISNLINVLEEKKELGTALGVVSPDGSKQDIQVYIGDEVPVESMKDCSVVTATYQMGDGVQGKIGIIGPRRMDYQKVVETLKATMNQLDGIFKKPEE